jgi:hypothetical protein
MIGPFVSLGSKTLPDSKIALPPVKQWQDKARQAMRACAASFIGQSSYKFRQKKGGESNLLTPPFPQFKESEFEAKPCVPFHWPAIRTDDRAKGRNCSA